MLALILLPLLIIIPLVVIAVVALLIYTAVYNHRIKKQLSGEATYKHQYIEPKSIIIIILSIMLVIMMIALTGVWNYKNPKINSDKYQSQFYSSEELENTPFSIYKNLYSRDSLNHYTAKPLEGYTREEKTEDNFRYILYKSEDDYISALYPTFIMFVEYTGNKSYEGCVAMDSMQFGDGSHETATLPDEIPEYFFVCGNADKNVDYAFTLGLYSERAVAQSDFDEQNCVGADELFEITI